MPSSTFTHHHVVRFHETDGAGVVYFANVLTLCHGAYEAALGAAGMDVKSFFGGAELAVPVVHASVDFRRPLYCGDEVAIALTPSSLDDTMFEIKYHLSTSGQKTIATALTRHVCIDSISRQRQPLSPELSGWLESVAPAPMDG